MAPRSLPDSQQRSRRFLGAHQGGLQLIPSAARQNDLRADYRDMSPMMFDETPLAFDEILARIQDLQDAVSAS